MNISNSNSLVHQSKIPNDKNNDGLLSNEEMGISQEEFNSYDANSDGMLNSNELKKSVVVNIDSHKEYIEDNNVDIQVKQSSPLSKLQAMMTISNNQTQDASTARKLNLYVSNLDINLKTI